MWREQIVRAAESWYICLVGVAPPTKPTTSVYTQSALGGSGPPTTVAGLFFSLPRGLRNRATPKAGAQRAPRTKSETDDHFSALLSPQGSGGAYVGEE